MQNRQENSHPAREHPTTKLSGARTTASKHYDAARRVRFSMG